MDERASARNSADREWAGQLVEEQAVAETAASGPLPSPEVIEMDVHLDDMMDELAKLQAEIRTLENDLKNADSPVKAKVVGALLRETQGKYDELQAKARDLMP